jgi:hypothetical protein
MYYYGYVEDVRPSVKIGRQHRKAPAEGTAQHSVLVFELSLFCSHRQCNLVEDSEVTVGDFLLDDADFPNGYVHMKHPDDAVVTEQATSAPVFSVDKAQTRT